MLDQNGEYQGPLGRPPNVESNVARLEACGSKHWSILPETQLRCCVCKARGVTKKVFMKWDCALKETCF